VNVKIRVYHESSRDHTVLTIFLNLNFNVFSARQHICYSALYAIARPSVCPSHGWISQRRLKLGTRNLHHRVAHDSSFLTLNFTVKFQREDMERGVE